MRIGYSIVDSRLGRLLVAGTARGICFVSLGDADEPLRSALSGDYPSAEIEPDAAVRQWADALAAHLDEPADQLDLPLDVEASEFQWQVWEALRRIPRGSTKTYGEIAKALGYGAAAARAVGRACATNPVSLVIPCHRAVREDGGLGGYRWGIARKRMLLEREAALSVLPFDSILDKERLKT